MKAHIESLVEYIQYLKELGYDGLPISRNPEVEKTNKISPDITTDNTKELAIQNIRLAVEQCNKCRLARTRIHPVPGEGNFNTELMFVGEAPGYDEDQQGKPFVGRAGKLLTDIIKAMGMTREDVFIANVIKCRPPENREPMDDEIAQCSPYLFKQIEIIKPKVIVTLGRYSTTTILGLNKQMRISELRGRFFNYNDIKVMPTFHPAYLLRNEKDKKLVWNDMKLVLKELGKPIPASR
ncbi:MAG: uracil-DNA glycosylase [bacterium]